MCINIEKIETLKKDITVWKVCRASREHDWYLSALPPGRRAPQGSHMIVDGTPQLAWEDIEGQGLQGKTKKYYVGKTHHSKPPGMYCFTSFGVATAYARRAWRSKTILECTIRAGTKVVYGRAFGDPTVLTPALKIEKHIPLPAEDSYYIGLATP